MLGGTEVGVDSLKPLRKLAKNYPIEILEKPSFGTLKDLYGRARIYWSASGFDVNEKKEPTKVEHFGITVVEAMSAGCVPLVVDAGGHKEIVKDGENGYVWKTTRELLKHTRELITDTKKMNTMARLAKKDSKIYSYERLENNVKKLL